MEMGDPRPRAETVVGKQFKASLLSRTKAHTIARSVRLMGGCAVLHPGWMEHYHYHEPVSVHGPDEGMSNRSADGGPPRLWLSFTAQVLSHTADPTAKGLRVEFTNPRQPGLAEAAQPPLAEEPIRPQLDRLWASPITVLPRDKRKSQRKKLRAARDSVLGFAERMPSRSLSNFGG